MASDGFCYFAQICLRRISSERRHDAEHLARAEGHVYAAADFNPAFQLSGNQVVELFAEGDFEGDARDHCQGHVVFLRGSAFAKQETEKLEIPMRSATLNADPGRAENRSGPRLGEESPNSIGRDAV